MPPGRPARRRPAPQRRRNKDKEQPMRRVDTRNPARPSRTSTSKRTGAFNAGALTAATAIIEDVRERGDAALRALHGAASTACAWRTSACRGGPSTRPTADVDDGTARALRQAAAQIRDFHERQKQQSWFTVREDGALVGSKVEPLESVGIYVPGGRALYPSTVLMNALPAAGGRRAAHRVRDAAHEGRHAGSGHPRRLPHRGRHRDLRGGRRPGRGGARLRHRVHRARWPRSPARATPSWRRPRRSSRAMWAST